MSPSALNSLIRLSIALLSLTAVPFGSILAQPVQHDGSDHSSVQQSPAEHPSPAAVITELDLDYAGDGNPRHRLDLLIPRNRKSDLIPALVYIHGGGWIEGDKSGALPGLKGYIESGEYAAISINYRLSREAIWPAQLYDCKAAIRWIRANAKRYGIDPERIGVFGGSAGGHLALMLGVTGDLPELEGDIGSFRQVSSRVNCVVNICGVSDIPALVGQQSQLDPTKPMDYVARLIGGPLPGNLEVAKAASPVTYVTAGDPPVLTIHGDSDPSVPYDQAVRIDAALQRAGVKSYFVTGKGGGHEDFGAAGAERVKQLFGKYLLGSDALVSTAPIEKLKP